MDAVRLLLTGERRERERERERKERETLKRSYEYFFRDEPDVTRVVILPLIILNLSPQDDFLLRHYDKGPCKNKLGHSRASVVWHRTQVIGIFAGFGLLILLASPLLILAAPCLLCCKCRYCTSSLDPDDSPVSI